jgi:hypothetical protein
MTDSPAVLVLVNDSAAREDVRQRLTALDVVPIPVRADRAVDALREFRPIAVVLDEAHAASAPDDFLETTSSHRVRLVTLPDANAESSARETALVDAATARRFY